MAEKLTEQKPCKTCKEDLQIGDPYSWKSPCEGCWKLYEWKEKCIERLREYEEADEN